jgi:hypothetical protein
MADGPAGFGTGIMEGQQLQQQQQANILALAEGKEKLQLTKLQVDQTRLAMRRQEAYIEQMRKLNHLHTEPGSTPSGPQDQARSVGSMYYQLAEAALAAGLPEEARGSAETASKLELNAAHIEEAEAQASKTKADFTSNMMNWVQEAPNQQEAQRRWQLSTLLFQEQFKSQSPYAGVPYSPELVDGLYKRAITAKDEADLEFKNAQTEKEKADAKLSGLRQGLVTEQTALTTARKDFLVKNGGMTRAQAEKAEAVHKARESSLKRIDELEALIEKDPDVVGFTGTLKDIKEFASTKTGIGSQTTTSTDFRTKLTELKTSIPQALDVKGTRLRIVQQHLDDLSNLRAKGTSAPQAKIILRDIREMLQEGEEHKAGTIKRKTGDTGKAYSSAEEVKAAFEAGKLSQEEALAVLRENFDME